MRDHLLICMWCLIFECGTEAIYLDQKCNLRYVNIGQNYKKGIHK